jgi:hypothetical protein
VGERVEDLRLVGYRLTRLEDHLHNDYLTAAQMMNQFVTREEMRAQAKTRREWWPIVLMAIAGLPGTLNLILTLKGLR